jgi:hypothetical protein
LKGVDYLSVVRKSTSFVFRKHHGAVRNDIKDAVSAFDEF